MASYLSKVRGLSKSTTSETTDAQVVNFLNAGVIFVINGIPKDLLTFLSSDSSAITDSNGYDITNDRVTMVRRNGIVCDQLPDSKIYAHSGALSVSSLYAGTTIFPKWYILNGKIYIKPDPSVGEPGYVTKITPPTIDENTTNTTLNEIENPVILYAAAMDAMALSGYFGLASMNRINSSTGDARDALDKARDLIDDSTGLSQGEDVEFYINDEDTEMMAANVNVAAQEVNRALAEIRGNESISSQTEQALLRSKQLFDRADAELTMYVERNSKMIGLQIAAAASGGR